MTNQEKLEAVKAKIVEAVPSIDRLILVKRLHEQSEEMINFLYDELK